MGGHQGKERTHGHEGYTEQGAEEAQLPKPALGAQNGEALPGVLPDAQLLLPAAHLQHRETGRQQAQNGESGAQGVDEDDPVEGEIGVQNGGQGRGDQEGDGLDALAPAGAFAEKLGGRQQRGDRLETGGVKRAAHAPQGQGGHDGPNREAAACGEEGQAKGDQADGAVGDYHDGTAVKAVGEGAGEKG